MRESGKVDGEDDEITIESAFFANKQGKRLPLEQDDGEDAQEFYALKGNSSDRNIYSTPLGARPKPRMVQIPPTYDKNKHSNQNRRPDYSQQTSTSTTNGPRRYSCKLGNIPGT